MVSPIPKAVILAAGEGKRLRPFTVSEPKVMVPVANRPIIEYIIEALAQNNIRDIIVVVGYRRERIMSHLEDGTAFGVNIEYVIQKKQVGTAHALLQARSSVDSEFIVLPGDNIIDASGIAELIKLGAPSVLLADQTAPTKFGVARTRGRKVITLMDKITRAEREAQPGGIQISTGIFMLTPEVFDLVETHLSEGTNDLTPVVQAMVDGGTALRYAKTSVWSEAVYPWDLLTTNAVALDTIKLKVAGTVENNVELRGAVAVGEGTTLRSGTYIMGNVIIGRGCEIGPNVCIYPSTSVGDNVTIGPFSKIKHSLIMNDVQLGASSSISNAVIGEGVYLGAHFIAESADALVHIEDAVHEVRDIGAIIGEDCTFGSDVVIAPGVIVGANCNVASMKCISANIPDKGIVV
jgi:glucose-1-phosphate thymidylyltransferase